MNKDIEMFQISDKGEPIGTEIFDSNLPSNIDFDQQQHQHVEKIPINPQKLPRLGKVITIGEDLKSYKVVGKASLLLQPNHFQGALINSHIHTFAAKIYDEASKAGFKKFWDSIVGYSKRQIHISQGYIYFLQNRKDGLLLYQLMKLTQLFKIFVDPEQDKIRLVFEQGERLINKDISPQKFILFLELLVYQLSKIGLGLQG